MPTYSFRNKETGEVFDEFMRISELDAFKESNPQLEQTLTQAPAFVGDHITIKKDSGFKEVLQRIKEKSPGADFDKTSSQI